MLKPSSIWERFSVKMSEKIAYLGGNSMKREHIYEKIAVRIIISIFVIAFTALLSVNKCYAKDKRLYYIRYKNEINYAEKKLDGIVPESAVKYAKDNYLSILKTSREFDNSLSFDLLACRLGEPIVFAEEGNTDEMYRFPIIERDKAVFLVTVINTDEGYSISGSTEYVDIINKSNNLEDNGLFFYKDGLLQSVDIDDPDYIQKVDETVDYIENFEEVDTDFIVSKNAKDESYTPTIYKNSAGTTVLCNLYNQVYQGTLPICWAASAATVANYRLGANFSGENMCAAANKGLEEGTIYDTQKALGYVGINYTATSAKIDLPHIKTNINNKYPFIMSMKTLTSGHQVTCYGYRKTDNGNHNLVLWNSGTNKSETVKFKPSGTVLPYNNQSFVWKYTVSMYK